MKTRLPIFLSLLMLSSTLWASDPISRAIDELIVLSGAEKQLSSMDEVILAGMQAQMAQQGGTLPPEVETHLAGVLAQAYAYDGIKKRLRHSLRQKLSVRDIKSVFGWLKSDLGRKITIEEERNSTPEAVIEAASVAPSLEVSPQRAKLLQQLDDAVDITQSSIDSALFSNIAIITGIVSTLPPEQRPSRAELQASIEQTRPQIEEAAKQQIALILRYMYRNISDAELQQYLNFHLTPSGEKYANSMQQGINDAMNQGALTLGDLLAQQAR